MIILLLFLFPGSGLMVNRLVTDVMPDLGNQLFQVVEVAVLVGVQEQDVDGPFDILDLFVGHPPARS